MFPWNFAKSAEAAFSRWAVKRVVKFLLKKKLGKLILGDIDLDQLDIQLRDGTIQLCDLAIDVDYLNHKFDAPLLIKEGSIGSLLVKMPWKTDGCQVELDELELVLAPRLESNASSSNEASTSTSTRDDSHSVRLGLGKHENEMLANGAKSASIDVHEGVKTVAKIVKWFLTSFHVKIKNLIIAFDPDFGKEQIGVGSRPTLVLRMTEIECGISEDPTSEVSHDSFLGINRLVNSVKFHGAVVEILNMDDDDDEKTCSKKASDDVTLIMTGEGGGFSGSLNLSMPWRNGSLDIRKVDADIFIDPIELRFQPSTIKWFLRLWKTFISFGSDSFPSHANSSTDSIPPSAIVMPPAALSLSGGQEVVPDITPELQFIPDWFPSSFSKKEEDGEVDIGGSVDQFFECFDAMRSYQSAFGSQGMWNWTSSVFTAINAASSLASGSLLLPSEQQHIETSCKVSFAGVSVVLFFQDEDTWKHLSTGIHYLGAELREISVSFQVRPQNMRLEGDVNSVEVADYFQAGNVTETTNAEYQSSLIKNLQAEVQATLPPFASSVMNADSERSCEIVSDGFLFCNKGLAVKTLLVIAAGDNGIHFMVNFQSSKAKSRGANSFSLSLPPTTFWLNLHSVEMLVNLFNDVSESIPITSQERNQVASSSQSERLQGRISILNARVILCFPFDSSSETLYKSLGEEFIVINLSSSLPSDKERRKDRNPGEMHFTSATRAVCFSVGDASIYLVSSDLKDSDTNSDRMQDEFSAYNIIVTNNRTSHQLSTIGIFWQDKPIVSPSLVERAKMLATHEESIQTGKSRGNGLEFAAVATAKDQEDIYSQTRKEIILASSFCLYVHLLPLAIRLDSWQYIKLCSLIDQAKNWLSCMSANITGKTEESVVCQTSLVVECDSADILVRPEPRRGINNQLQVELPGSWIQFNLRVQKLNIMSVSNLGSISGAHLFWLCHGEGTLWGSITGLPDQELLLLSCDNSAIKRGNGGGSNALSSRFAGLDILHLQEPETCYDYLSVSARGCTISAVGGRLDWIDVASSFFTFQVGEKSEERKSSASSGSSFNLCLVDIGLSYEPRHENTDHIPQSSDPLVACLLAASSFSLSKTSLVDSKRNDYIIRIQDLGLFLSVNMDRSRLDGTYSSENLHETGYVKVANGALIKAALRTNSESGALWELECSKSHLLIETCSDTTSGLTRLATQLQQLFAPDLEESAVHLQTRWDNIQQANAKNDFGNSSKLSSSDSSGENLRLDSETGVVGLMGEINEDAFQFDVSHSRQPDSLECQNNYMSPHGQSSPVKVPLCGSSSRLKPESSQIFLERDRLPEIIENYCLSTSLPSSEVPQEGDSSRRPLFLETDLRRGNSGWYDDVSLRILEDHLSEATEEDQEERILDGEFSSSDLTSHSVVAAIGRVLLKKIDLKWRIYSGSDWADSRKKNTKGRDTTSCLELELSGVQFLYEICPIGGICTSSLSLMVQDFYLYDRSKAAPWTLVLGYYNSKERPRDSSSDAFKLELKAVRPDPGTPLEENRLRVALLPILLHLHQSQLDFLINFFGANNIEKSVVSVENSDGSTLPVSVKELNIIEEAFLPYFQKFDIWPVSVRVDYSPHHVDIAALTGGKYAELLNLVPWKGIELHLKHVHAAGIYGWGNVCETILGEWLEDISQNQIRQLLKGIPTLKSLSALYAAATKLVSSPVESYRKDRRLVKGVQRGTIAFLRSISLEAVGLGVHLAAGAHDILLRAEYMFASAPSLPQPQGKTKTNVRHNQPRNAKQGMLQACESISDGIGKSASALVRAPLKKYQRGDGAGSAFATAVQGVPTAAIATASAVARAGHTTFVGFRNSLDPEHKKESMEKYSGPNKQRNQDQHR